MRYESGAQWWAFLLHDEVKRCVCICQCWQQQHWWGWWCCCDVLVVVLMMVAVTAAVASVFLFHINVQHSIVYTLWAAHLKKKIQMRSVYGSLLNLFFRFNVTTFATHKTVFDAQFKFYACTKYTLKQVLTGENRNSTSPQLLA